MSFYLSSLGYPFRERPAVFVFGVLMIWAMYLAQWAPWIGTLACLFVTGYLCAFCSRIVQQTALGEDGICTFPDFEGCMDTLVMPFIRVIGCALVASLPVFAVLACADWGEDASPGTVLLLFLARLLGSAYFPLALMRTLALESLHGLSPAGWWRTVRRIPLPCLGLTALVCLVQQVCTWLPEGMLFDFLTAPVAFYVLCVLMNVFGLFMRKHEQDMGWDE